MITIRMFHLRGLLCVALLGASACGDDSSSAEGTESSSSGSETGSGSTTQPETMTMTMTASAEGSSGGTTTTDEGTSSSGVADSSGSGSSESTGTPGDCAAQADQKTCEMTEGCVWVGNVQSGECLSLDPGICADLEMQACQQHPSCDWSNQDETCGPA